MAVPTDSVGLAISIAAGVIKLGGRIDRIASEQIVAKAELRLATPPVALPPPVPRLKAALADFVNGPGAEGLPEPERQRLRALAAAADPDEAALHDAIRRHVPAAFVLELSDPDGAFARHLLQRGFDLADRDVRAAVGCIAAGVDLRSQSVWWQIGVAVADVVAELALENQRFLVRDEGGRALLGAVLTRFADTNLDTIGTWRGLLVHVLRATIDGALEQKGRLAGDRAWLEGLLGALQKARERGGDDFFVGLVRAQGYRSLVAALLEEGAARLGGADARAFERIASAVLQDAAGRAANNSSFARFFRDHWSSLLSAGLGALHREAPALLEGADPLLQRVLVAAVGALATDPAPDFRSREIFVTAVESAIGVVAREPALLQSQPEWLREFLVAASATVSSEGLARAVSRDGVERLARRVIERLAERPELLARRPGLPRELARGVLEAVAKSPATGLEAIATAALDGALDALGENPRLLDLGDGRYAGVVADLARWAALQVSSGRLSRVEAADLVRGAIGAVGANPQLFVVTRDALAREIAEHVIAALAHPQQGVPAVAQPPVATLVAAVLEVAAARGQLLIAAAAPEQLAFQIEAIVVLGLRLAADALGRRLDRRALPRVIAAFLDTWARGALPSLDASDAQLRDAFAALAERTRATL